MQTDIPDKNQQPTITTLYLDLEAGYPKIAQLWLAKWYVPGEGSSTTKLYNMITRLFPHDEFFEQTPLWAMISDRKYSSLQEVLDVINK